MLVDIRCYINAEKLVPDHGPYLSCNTNSQSLPFQKTKEETADKAPSSRRGGNHTVKLSSSS